MSFPTIWLKILAKNFFCFQSSFFLYLSRSRKRKKWERSERKNKQKHNPINVKRRRMKLITRSRKGKVTDEKRSKFWWNMLMQKSITLLSSQFLSMQMAKIRSFVKKFYVKLLESILQVYGTHCTFSFSPMVHSRQKRKD